MKPDGAKVTQMTTTRDRGGLPKSLKTAGLILGGTFVASLMIGWIAFLLWLMAEGVIAIVSWL